MAAQIPSDTFTPEQRGARWLDEAYAAGCVKRVAIRPATAIERQNGEREMVMGEIIMRKDQPGRFYDPHGREVSDDVARRAGFNVEHWRRQGEKERRLAAARAKIEAEFAAEAEKIEVQTVVGGIEPGEDGQA